MLIINFNSAVSAELQKELTTIFDKSGYAPKFKSARVLELSKGRTDVNDILKTLNAKGLQYTFQLKESKKSLADFLIESYKAGNDPAALISQGVQRLEEEDLLASGELTVRLQNSPDVPEFDISRLDDGSLRLQFRDITNPELPAISKRVWKLLQDLSPTAELIEFYDLGFIFNDETYTPIEGSIQESKESRDVIPAEYK